MAAESTKKRFAISKSILGFKTKELMALEYLTHM
jgi:hypothetical protein